MRCEKDGDVAGACESVRWKDREAARLANGLIEMIVLAQGGHIASLRFVSDSANLMWEAPWRLQDAAEEWSRDRIDDYGPAEIGKFLAGYTGHALCLDCFGLPSPAGIAAGRSLHGEAAVNHWTLDAVGENSTAQLRCSVGLRDAGLSFERKIHLGPGESVLYIEETVCNRRGSARRFDWVQHVTFGPAFLHKSESTLEASACRGITSQEEYRNGGLLKAGTEFEWPSALHESGGIHVDLRQPFSARGRGFLAGLQMDGNRRQQFLVAINWKSRVGIAYCFRLSDFPWMTVWEENCSRSGAPWNGTTAARGMEFGTSPLPFGEQEGRPPREVFGLTTGCEIPAKGHRSARYIITMFHLPDAVESIANVEAVGNQIVMSGVGGEKKVRVNAAGVESFLFGEGATDETFREQAK